MPPRRVNVNTNRVNGVVNPLEGDRTLVSPVRPHRLSAFYESVKPLVHAMVGAFQRVASGNVASANQGLPLEHLRASRW
ncbi:hypothetical protein J1N35_011528 [Gossypium stocksii]|uniref:Uncharacterized protein n=1 Tax=Gossypium stocksii TaxID=47602 RepID=A0A9D4ADH3_9ROSI|nr:hypothetical protein J1N35_011528 [Gossypium stocksii]